MKAATCKVCPVNFRAFLEEESFCCVAGGCFGAMAAAEGGARASCRRQQEC